MELIEVIFRVIAAILWWRWVESHEALPRFMPAAAARELKRLRANAFQTTVTT